MTKPTSPLTSLLLAAAAVVLVTAVGGSALTSLGASGQQTARTTLPPPPPPPPPDGGPAGLEGRLLDRLGLSAAQWDQVDSIFERAGADAEPYREQERAARDAMREAVQADVFDEAAVRAIAASQADATVEIAVIDARAQSEIYTLLTAEQRARLATLTREPPRPRR